MNIKSQKIPMGLGSCKEDDEDQDEQKDDFKFGRNRMKAKMNVGGAKFLPQ